MADSPFGLVVSNASAVAEIVVHFAGTVRILRWPVDPRAIRSHVRPQAAAGSEAALVHLDGRVLPAQRSCARDLASGKHSRV